MARTQAADYDERKEAIVEAAAALFAQRGYESASVAGLADRLGASKALIYHYYQSKEEILYEVMISHVRALDRAAHDAIAEAGAPEARLRVLTRAFMRLYVGAADRHKVLLNELDKLPSQRRAEIVAVQRGLIEIVRALLSEIEPGLNKGSGRSLAAAMLFFGAINWTHTWFDPKGDISPDALADMAVGFTLNGFRRGAS